MSDRATHKTGEAIVISRTPDVCKTPMGSSMVPVPYPIVAQFDAAQQVASKTNFEGDPAFHMGSHLPRVQGDEAGVGGGVVSGVNMGCCKPVEHSGTLRTEGEWVVRHGDLMDMNCAGPSGTGNTQGKIVFVACLKQSRVNADGSIEYAGERRSVDEAGNETVERVQVTQSADGRIEQATYGEATRDAAGNVSVQETSVAFDGEGRLSEQSFVSAEQRAPMNNDPRGPVLGSDAIGKPTGDGRVYLGDGMYAPVGGAPRAAGIAVMDPASVDPRADADYQQAVDEVAVAQAEVDAITAEQVLDATQMTIDLAGIADPTPLSDGVSAAISVARGDWLGAGLSIVSMVPYFGDALAKPAKAAKAAAKGTKLAAKLEKAAAKLKKAKEALEAAGKKIGKKLGKGGGSGSDGGLIKRGGGGGGRGPRGGKYGKVAKEGKRLSRREQKEWLRQNGFSQKEVKQAMDGIDPNQPVYLRTLEPGERLVQFPDHPSLDYPQGAVGGTWFGVPGATMDGVAVGSGPAGRGMVEMTVQRPVQVLESSAREIIPKVPYDRFRGSGGATQIIIPRSGLGSLR